MLELNDVLASELTTRIMIFVSVMFIALLLMSYILIRSLSSVAVERSVAIPSCWRRRSSPRFLVRVSGRP